MDFFLKSVNISANQMISGDSKGVNNRHVWFGSIISSGKGCNEHCILCMVKFWLAINIVSDVSTKRFWNIFSRSSSAANEPNFKIICNCIHELLNVFEDPAQCVHIIAEWKQSKLCVDGIMHVTVTSLWLSAFRILHYKLACVGWEKLKERLAGEPVG